MTIKSIPTSKPYRVKYATYNKANNEFIREDYHTHCIPSGLDRLKVTYGRIARCPDVWGPMLESHPRRHGIHKSARFSNQRVQAPSTSRITIFSFPSTGPHHRPMCDPLRGTKHGHRPPLETAARYILSCKGAHHKNALRRSQGTGSWLGLPPNQGFSTIALHRRRHDTPGGQH